MNKTIDIHINLLQYQDQLKLEESNGVKFVFDPIRKKSVRFFPEESVRQLFIQYLLLEKNYSPNHIKVEKSLLVNGMQKRCDILIYNKEIQPIFIIECKAPYVNINQKVIDQVAAYNIETRVPFLAVSNGRNHFCLQVDFENKQHKMLEEIPVYLELLKKAGKRT